MHKQNCLNCKKMRHDLSFFRDMQIHCMVYNENLPWYMAQHITREQFDLIAMVGCASWESNQ